MLLPAFQSPRDGEKDIVQRSRARAPPGNAKTPRLARVPAGRPMGSGVEATSRAIGFLQRERVACRGHLAKATSYSVCGSDRTRNGLCAFQLVKQ